MREKRAAESIIKLVAIILFIIFAAIAVAVLIYGWVGGHFESIETLREYIASFGIWGPIVLTVIQLLQVVLPVLPGFMGCIVGAMLFGPMVGFWVNYIGISAGSIIAFWLAKRFGVKLVGKMVKLEKYDKWIKRIERSKSYTVVLALSILLPLAPDDFLCYFSGLLNMTMKKFVAIIVLAKPWCILFYSIFFELFI